MASFKKRISDEEDRSVNQKRRIPAGSSDDDEINVITATGEIIPVTIKGSDTIDEIKLKIHAKNGIPFGQQEFFFKQKVVDTLPIKEEPTLKLMSESMAFMNIFINNLEGKAISSLEVKSSDTIGNVKAKIGRSGCVLMFNGAVLEDTGTLADFNVINGSTLTRFDVSKRQMEIFVKTFIGKTISLLVTPTDTISNVKLEIMYRERIPVEDQVLIFNGMALGDSGSIFDFNIKKESTLTLVRRSRGLMRIYIKTFAKGIVTIDVNPSHTIGNVKSKIQDEVNIPHDEQEFIFNEMVLHNNDTLADYNIKKGSTLTVVRISSGYMLVYIKTQSLKTIPMRVKPSNTIYNVKSKIAEIEGIAHCQVILLFDGRRPVDSATLADYHIHNESTVDCFVQRKGG